MKGRTYCELLYIERVAFSPILDLVVVNDQFNGHIVCNLWLTLLILRDVSATDLYEYLAQLIFSVFNLLHSFPKSRRFVCSKYGLHSFNIIRALKLVKFRQATLR